MAGTSALMADNPRPCRRQRLQEISGESQEKQEPRCKPFISLAAITRHVPQSRTLHSRHQVRSSDERCVMEWCNLPSYYWRLSAEGCHTFDRWLKANAIFGSIFAVVLIAMAFAGSWSIAPRDAAVASGTPTAYEGSESEQRRTRTEVAYRRRLKTFGQ
jgi:hypothetical protein